MRPESERGARRAVEREDVAVEGAEPGGTTGWTPGSTRAACFSAQRLRNPVLDAYAAVAVALIHFLGNFSKRGILKAFCLSAPG
jgi:hypothetical protein